MKLEGVCSACDLNPLYLEFIPMFVKSWKKLFPEILIRIVLIAQAIPEEYMEYKDYIVLFPDLKDTKIHTAFQAQTIRLLEPRNFPVSGAVMITDIDMIPLNRNYYIKAAEACTDTTFVISRTSSGTLSAMCYCLATPSTWTKVFSDVPAATLLRQWSPPAYNGTPSHTSWFTDQRILTIHVKHYGIVKYLKDSDLKFQRLDRAHTHMFVVNRRIDLRKRIQTGIYHDYHALRPYSEFKEVNDFVLESILLINE
jgi:hypothetical protein